MKIMRISLIVSVLIISLCVTSCTLLNADRFLIDDGKLSETRFQNIIEAIEKKDKKGLKKMFSTNALKEAEDIDEGIEYIFKFYKGKIISKDDSSQGSGSNEYGKRTYELKSCYTVKTDKDTYTVFFIDQIVDTADKDNVGLYMIQIIKDSDNDRQFDWGVVYKCAGIYRPASADNK